MDEMRKRVLHQSAWANGLTYEDIPEEAVTRARWVLLDSIGCIISGLGGRKLPENRSEALLLGSSSMAMTELYEGNRFSCGHPACHIVPILLAEAESAGITYKEMIRIFVCAYEIASRWGRTIRLDMDMLGHGTVLTAGASVVEGLINGLSDEDFADYIMTTQALPEVSTWQSVFEGSYIHNFYPGMSAVNARDALYMSGEGVRCSDELVRSVFDKIKNTQLKTENIDHELGSEWYLPKNYFKVHSGCRFIHQFADVVKDFMDEGLKKEDVSEIHVRTYKKAARIDGQKVINSLAAKFSTPVSLAILLIKGRLYPEDIEEAIDHNRYEVADLASRIYLEEDGKYNSLLPDVRGGSVQVIRKDGSSVKTEVFHARGDFDDPAGYTENDLSEKFREVTEGKIESKVQEGLIGNILHGSIDTRADEILEDYYRTVR